MNGDGVAEIAIVTDRPVDGTNEIQLWEVTTPPGGSLAVLPFIDLKRRSGDVHVGHREQLGRERTDDLRSVLHRPGRPSHSSSQWQATPTGPGSYHVSEHGYHIVGTDLRSAFEDSYDVPGEETAFPDGGGSTLCGVPILP